MDAADQMDQVYEAMVFWGDVILLATPIRWGVASSLYFKMAERLNCVQNQITIRNRVMLRNKVASFIITGGQDNVQGVAGQALTFFAELGCQFPQFPYVAHTRGWSAEDMEHNVDYVRASTELHDGARALVDRGIEMARRLIATDPAVAPWLHRVLDGHIALDVDTTSTMFGFAKHLKFGGEVGEISLALLGVTVVLTIGSMWRRRALREQHAEVSAAA